MIVNIGSKEALLEEQYAAEIYKLLVSLFDTNNENYRYSLSEVEWTEFFTGIILASAILLNRLSSEDEQKTLLEYHTIQSGLIFDYLRKSNADLVKLAKVEGNL